MFAALADGLRHAHEHGIHHRDVKAENVIIGADGWGTLVDFGVALKHGASRLTSAGFVMGTFAYLPPEVVGGADRDPVLADVYGLGQLLCEVVAGHPLFRGDPAWSPSQRWSELVTAKVSSGPLDPGDGFPAPLRDLIRRATQPEPEDRTPSIGELADGLRALLDDKQDEALEGRLGETWGPTGAGPPRPASPVAREAAPQRSPVRFVVLGLLGIGFGLAFGTAMVVAVGIGVAAALWLR
jgi:serine/threonine protein kinase